MKRNYDLIRDILLTVELEPAGGRIITLEAEQFQAKYPELTDDVLNYHIELLVENDFLDGEGHQHGWFIIKLTWKGHDFLDAAKVNSVWEKAKKFAGHQGIDIFTTFMKESVLSFIRSQAGF